MSQYISSLVCIGGSEAAVDIILLHRADGESSMARGVEDSLFTPRIFMLVVVMHRSMVAEVEGKLDTRQTFMRVVGTYHSMTVEGDMHNRAIVEVDTHRKLKVEVDIYHRIMVEVDIYHKIMVAAGTQVVVGMDVVSRATNTKRIQRRGRITEEERDSAACVICSRMRRRAKDVYQSLQILDIKMALYMY
jgi:hypothetical protein